MKLIEQEQYAVARAVIDDAVRFEGGTVELNDERGASVIVGDWRKCVFGTAGDFAEFAAERGIRGRVCLIAAPKTAPQALGVEADECKMFAYMRALPPRLGPLSVKRLAHTLAQVVAQNYKNRDHTMTEQEADEIMRGKGVFGAFVDSKLAGFIGRHPDGSMGMLTVFENYRRRGIGEGLEAFMINYVMTFGRIPFCDVYTDNAPSLSLQKKLGLTESPGYTFWIEKL